MYTCIHNFSILHKMNNSRMLLITLPYNIMAKHLRRILSHLEWKMAICWKTFVVACLYTYIANGQGHKLREKIHD